jgi:hypothetical protein
MATTGVAAQHFVRKPALKQPNHLGKAGVEVQLLGLAERLGPAVKQELRDRVAQRAGDIFQLG